MQLTNRCVSKASRKKIPSKRKVAIKKFLETSAVNEEVLSIEHIFKNRDGVRTILPISIVELTSRQAREFVLNSIGQSKLEDGAGGQVTATRAKTAVQLKRNHCLQNVADKAKTDQRCNGKHVEIAWKIEGGKDRGVKVDGRLIFLQTPVDILGKFPAPFEDLIL